MHIDLCEPFFDAEIDLRVPSQIAFLRGEKIKSTTRDGKMITWDWRNPVVGTNDDSFPGVVNFSWTCDISADFTLFIADNPAMSSPTVRHCGSRCSCSLDNLQIGTQYFWRIAAHAGENEICRSDVFRFATAELPPRWLRIPGLSNVRDCGGWLSAQGGRVKQGMLYRGSEMDNHMHITDAGRRIMLDELKIRTDLDIRSAEETRKAGRRSALGTDEINYLFYELKPYDLFFQAENARLNAACFTELLSPECYPVYCHCYGGADRTGTLIFMLLALLGVSDDDLVKDYELTTFSAFGTRSCESDYFVALCNRLNEYGTTAESFAVKAERYFGTIGVGINKIKKFRDILLS